MIGYYQILDTIKAKLLEDNFCKTTSSGSIFNVALNKQDIYPISHIIVNSFAEEGEAFNYNISVLCMDLVNDDDSNEEDVIHTQSMVAIRLVESLRRGNLFRDLLIDERFAPIQKSSKKVVPLIDWKYLLGLLILFWLYHSCHSCLTSSGCSSLHLLPFLAIFSLLSSLYCFICSILSLYHLAWYSLFSLIFFYISCNEKIYS